MKKLMKVAIPTDNGSVVRSRFRGARGFLVATIESGEIVHQELRWNLLSEMIMSEHGSFYNLYDCDAVIVNEIGQCTCQRLKAENKDIIQTIETDIPQAFIKYLDGIPEFSNVN